MLGTGFFLTGTVGCSGNAQPQSLPTNSKLAMLMETCCKSQHATADSQQKAVHLVSACAVAHPNVYSMLWPTLEQVMWTGQKPGTHLTAAAGMCINTPHHSERFADSIMTQIYTQHRCSSWYVH